MGFLEQIVSKFCGRKDEERFRLGRIDKHQNPPSLRREQLPINVSEHPKYGLVYTRKDVGAATMKMVSFTTRPGNKGCVLRFSARAVHQAPYLARLNQIYPEHFPKVYGFTDPTHTAYMMRYIRGESVHDYVARGGAVPPSLVNSICSLVDDMHKKGLAHGDLTPSNVLLTFDNRGQPDGFFIIDPIPPVLFAEDDTSEKVDTSIKGLTEILQEEDRRQLRRWLMSRD